MNIKITLESYLDGFLLSKTEIKKLLKIVINLLEEMFNLLKSIYDFILRRAKKQETIN